MMMALSVVFVGVVSFISVYSHVLMMLLSLEFVMLGLFYLLVLLFGVNVGEMYFSLVFFTLMVCEGALGLSIVVVLNRVWGNDYLLGLNLLEC